MWSITEEGEENRRSAVLLSLMASLLYGSQFVVIKTGIGDIDPLLFGAMTSAIGGLVALAYVLPKGYISWRTFTRWEVWGGVGTTTAMISLQYTGLTMAPASIGGLIVGSNIIFVAPISALVFKERLGWRRALGIGLGLIGLTTITTNWNLSTLASGTLSGYIMLIGASLCIALTYPLIRVATRRMRFEEWVTGFHLLTPIPLLLLALADGDLGSTENTNALAILFVGVLCTSIPTMLWAKGLESLTFVTSATILLSESVFAVLLGLLLLGEQITGLTFAGVGMVFAAIFLASSGDKNVKGERS